MKPVKVFRFKGGSPESEGGCMAVLKREEEEAAVMPESPESVEAGAAASAPAATPVAARAPVARSCAACAFWWKQSVSTGEARPKEAACHRGPPLAGGLWAQWPQTRPLDWCGGFEPR